METRYARKLVQKPNEEKGRRERRRSTEGPGPVPPPPPPPPLLPGRARVPETGSVQVPEPNSRPRPRPTTWKVAHPLPGAPQGPGVFSGAGQEAIHPPPPREWPEWAQLCSQSPLPPNLQRTEHKCPLTSLPSLYIVLGEDGSFCKQREAQKPPDDSIKATGHKGAKNPVWATCTPTPSAWCWLHPCLRLAWQLT